MKETKYPGLYVTTDGRVFSNTRGPIVELRQNPDTSGYNLISYKHKNYKVHRLIAETFIDNPDNLPQVNHIDKVRTNNNVDNLEWVTLQRNVEHAHAKHFLLENIKTGERVSVYNLSKFARENDLDHRSLFKTMTPMDRQRGRWSHKGWRVLSNRLGT